MLNIKYLVECWPNILPTFYQHSTSFQTINRGAKIKNTSLRNDLSVYTDIDVRADGLYLSLLMCMFYDRYYCSEK